MCCESQQHRLLIQIPIKLRFCCTTSLEILLTLDNVDPNNFFPPCTLTSVLYLVPKIVRQDNILWNSSFEPNEQQPTQEAVWTDIISLCTVISRTSCCTLTDIFNCTISLNELVLKVKCRSAESI